MNKRQKLVQQQFLNNEEAVIRRLNQVYSKSLSDITEKIKNLTFTIGELQEKYDWLDPDDPERARIKSMIQSKIYQKKYQEQLQKQLDGILKRMQICEFEDIAEYLDTCYTDGFIGTVFDAHGQGIPMVTPIDQESMVRAVQLDSKISQGLYTKLGEDVGLLKRKITAQVSRSIATGMTFAQTAKALADCTRIGYNKAIRIARTEGHRVQCTATMDAMSVAKSKGANVVKQWDSTLDGRTRHSHAVIDGEIREVDEVFSNGLRFPGDPHGSAAEVVNCRCALLQRAKWALKEGKNPDTGEVMYTDDEFTKFDRDSGVVQQFSGIEDYNKFKQRYMKVTGGTDPEPKVIDLFSFTEDQKEAIQWYVSGEGQFINQYYRGRVGSDFGELSDMEKELSGLLDEATDRILPDDITSLYRSVDARAIFGDIDAIDFDNLCQYLNYGDGAFGKGAYAEGIKRKVEDVLNKAKGKTITERGFMSTSKSYDVVESWGDFTGAEMPMVIEFDDIPKGVKGADLKLFDIEGDEQSEVLLARNTKYQILDIYMKDGQIHVKAKFIF